MKLFGKKNRENDTPPPAQKQPPKPPIQIAFEKNLKFMNQVSYPNEFFEGFFTESDRISTHIAGYADFPTGKVVIADPLVYLGTKYETVLHREIPKGSYPVELSVLYSQTAGLRIAAARLRVREEKAAAYKLAMPDGHTEEDINKPGVFVFMGVDAGMACFTDKRISEEYDAFLRKWHTENPDKNHYDDYFAAYFAESYENCPEFQREGGDFIEWTIPEGQNKLVMFASGLGDGIYCGYWGENSSGEITELVIPFLNPEFFP